MTTNALIRQAWKDYVFSTINNGENAFDYDFWPEDRKRREAGLVNGIYDFWLYHVRHRVEPQMCNKELRIFEVEIVRVLQNDLTGQNHISVVDDLNVTIAGLVKTALGDTWQGTVDLWRPPAESPRPERSSFAEQETFEARVIYTAEVLTNYS